MTRNRRPPPRPTGRRRQTWYGIAMPGNLADPDYEPSDEELQQLARDAFADVPARHHAARQRMWEKIAALRAQVLARLANREPSKP